MNSSSGEQATGGGLGPLSEAEHALDELLSAAHVLAAHQIPELLMKHGNRLGVGDVVAYLVDLQQYELVPMVPPAGPPGQETLVPLAVDSTLAGRAYQHVETLTRTLRGGAEQVWLPMLDGAERLGVLGVTVRHADLLEVNDGALLVRLRRLAAVAAELVMTKTMYGDTLVRLRRRAAMGLAAEMQWSLLPPLTFASDRVTIAAALEPAYEVAGDTVDYAVDAAVAHVAVFDGMGHGLQSAQLAVLTVAAYRNARRAQRELSDTLHAIDSALFAGFGGEAFATAIIAELDTTTGDLRWISAGHPEPLLLRDGRLVKTLHTNPASPLGLGYLTADDTGGSFAIGHQRLEPGDRVLLYTDGVVEARSPDGAFFGVQQLTDLVITHLASGLPTPETMRRVVHALLEHQQGRLSDDATLLLLEWRSDNQKSLQP
jgi:serine phosphatase RsbU (regulator of sigma subunit)